MTIWKFPLETTDIQLVAMPKGSAVLTVQTQGNQPCLWALCDPGQPSLMRSIGLYGTGHQLDSAIGVYIGTCQTHNGRLVWHVFDQTVPPAGGTK